MRSTKKNTHKEIKETHRRWFWGPPSKFHNRSFKKLSKTLIIFTFLFLLKRKQTLFQKFYINFFLCRCIFSLSILFGYCLLFMFALFLWRPVCRKRIFTCSERSIAFHKNSQRKSNYRHFYYFFQKGKYIVMNANIHWNTTYRWYFRIKTRQR